MRTDWRHRVVVAKIAEGCTYVEAATAAGVSRISVWMWCQASPDFHEAVATAREAGKKERTFRLWLRHPFRGLRPPAGKGVGGKPKFAFGRR